MFGVALAVKKYPQLGNATLRALDWFQFEKLIALLFERERFSVQRFGGAKAERVKKTANVLALILIILSFGLVCPGATNLATWEVIENKWQSVPTNEVVRHASEGDGGAQYYLGRAYTDGLRGFPINFAEGHKWWKRSAENNFAQAQNSLGYLHANGIGTPTNLDEARKWYRLAADQGYSRAEMNIAMLYWNGIGVPKDVREAANWYRKAARNGLLLAKRDLGIILLDEPQFGVSERAEGKKWITKAAEEGDAIAQLRFGWMLWKGQGVEPDRNSARRWLIKSAEQGVQGAMENLFFFGAPSDDEALTNLFRIALKFAESGVPAAQEMVSKLYTTGLGVTQDRQKEIVWLEKAAAQDYLPAIISAGNWYDNSGPNEDRKKAFRFFERAAAKGSLQARARVAELLINGQGGVLDERRGLALLHEVAREGVVSAQYDLATRYHEGRGVVTNIQQAIYWYDQVAEATNWTGTVQSWSAMTLGIMYATGDRVERDDAKAFRYFVIGTAWNAPDAYDSTGYCYATGRGVRKNDYAAVAAFETGARAGNTNDESIFYPAVANLGVMHAMGRGGLKPDMEKAAALFERAVNEPIDFRCVVPQAHTALAICLYEGSGVKRDVARAFKLFQYAAARGNSQAQLHFGVLSWRGEETEKNSTNAFMYLEAAADQKEPGATAWRDRVARGLTSGQKAEGIKRARTITTMQSACEGIYGLKVWNTGLRIPNLAIVSVVE
jgi:TPR repeat protein